MAEADKATIFSLPDDIRLSIFEYLLVPGCFELAYLDDFGKRRRTHMVRPEYAETPSGERHRCHPMKARKWHNEKAALIQRYGYDAKYLQYQLHPARSAMPGVGPHNPRICDLNKPTLSERGLRQPRRYATCGCGACDWRASTRCTPGVCAEFFAPLLVCKALYLELRTLIFSENVFSFRTPLDLRKFLSRLST